MDTNHLTNAGVVSYLDVMGEVMASMCFVNVSADDLSFFHNYLTPYAQEVKILSRETVAQYNYHQLNFDKKAIRVDKRLQKHGVFEFVLELISPYYMPPSPSEIL